MAWLAGSILLAGAAFALQTTERSLSDRDLSKLSKAIGEYFEALEEGKGAMEAEAEISEQFQDLQKKVDKAGAESILALPADLGQAIWLSHEYHRNKRAKPGKVATFEYLRGNLFTKKNPLEYTVALPNGYKPKERWPLVIAIPPVDQDPKAHLGEDWESGDFRDGAILAIPHMPEKPEDWSGQAGLARVLLTMQQVTENFAVDPDRVYLAGTGKGVEVALHIGSMRSFAFAGIIGRRGDSGEVKAEGFCNLPTLLSGAGAKAAAFETRAKELGFENCTLVANAGLEDIWKWIQETPRNSFPTSLEYWPQTESHVRSNWVEVARGAASEGAHVKASIDSASNTITLEGEGVPSVNLYLSDAMVDLDRPLRIVANGAMREVKVVRSRVTFLEMLRYARLDPGQVYVASERVDMPTPANAESEESGK